MDSELLQMAIKSLAAKVLSPYLSGLIIRFFEKIHFSPSVKSAVLASLSDLRYFYYYINIMLIPIRSPKRSLFCGLKDENKRHFRIFVSEVVKVFGCQTELCNTVEKYKIIPR